MNANSGLSWNLGGWLGSQLGGSAWILVAGLLTLPRDITTGLEVLAVFAFANACGLTLWGRRNSISAYLGMQLLLLLMGIASFVAVFFLDSAGHFEAIQSGGAVSAVEMYGLILIVIAGLMLMFYLRFGRGSRL